MSEAISYDLSWLHASFQGSSLARILAFMNSRSEVTCNIPGCANFCPKLTVHINAYRSEKKVLLVIIVKKFIADIIIILFSDSSYQNLPAISFLAGFVHTNYEKIIIQWHTLHPIVRRRFEHLHHASMSRVNRYPCIF